MNNAIPDPRDSIITDSSIPEVMEDEGVSASASTEELKECAGSEIPRDYKRERQKSLQVQNRQHRVAFGFVSPKFMSKSAVGEGNE